MKNTNQLEKVNSSISRSSFIKQSSLSFLSLMSIGSLLGCSKESKAGPSSEGDNDSKAIKTISYNVFNGCIGYQGVGSRDLPNESKYDLLRKARELGQVPTRIAMDLKLYDPDIISFSEGPDEDVLADMADFLGMNYVFFPTSKYHGHYPGGVLTRLDILDSENKPFVDKSIDDPENLFTRHWGKVKLKLSSGQTISVHSLHTWPFERNNQDKTIRKTEITEVIKSIHEDLDKNVDSVLLQGDLNLTPDTELYDQLISSGLIDSFDKVGDRSGFTATSQATFLRKDFIFGMGRVSQSFTSSKTLYEIGFRLNSSDEKSFAFSDHLPVLTEFDL